MTPTAFGSGFDPGMEFDRQVQNLIGKGYLAMSGLTQEMFVGLVSPLREIVVARGAAMESPSEGRIPFLLVITRDLAPIERSVTLTTLKGKNKPGITDRNYAAGDIERFTPVKELEIPDERAYLLFDVNRGEEFRNAVPESAMAAIADRGRTPLTMEEGIAFVTHHPEALAKNKCFSLGGSRCGDRRVPAMWISQGAPKLGWCWAGNPHTWLGMASCGDRTGPP